MNIQCNSLILVLLDGVHNLKLRFFNSTIYIIQLNTIIRSIKILSIWCYFSIYLLYVSVAK